MAWAVAPTGRRFGAGEPIRRRECGATVGLGRCKTSSRRLKPNHPLQPIHPKAGCLNLVGVAGQVTSSTIIVGTHYSHDQVATCGCSPVVRRCAVADGAAQFPLLELQHRTAKLD